MKLHRIMKIYMHGVVLVVLDVNKEVSSNALNWALGHVARKGDALRLVGVLTHILNPMGYKCRVDENSWTGANRKILETEIAHKKFMLQNIEDLDVWCEKAGVQLVIEVKAGLHPKLIVVEEAKTSGAYHVVIDRTMKKDRKYFIDHLTCFVTRVRNSGGVDSIRSFAISKQLPPVVPHGGASTPRSTPRSIQSTQSNGIPSRSVSSMFSSLRSGGGGNSSSFGSTSSSSSSSIINDTKSTVSSEFNTFDSQSTGPPTASSIASTTYRASSTNSPSCYSISSFETYSSADHELFNITKNPSGDHHEQQLLLNVDVPASDSSLTCSFKAINMQPSTQIQCSTDVKTLQQTKPNPVAAWLSNDTTHEPDERLHDEAPNCCYLQQQDHQRPFAAAAAAHGLAGLPRVRTSVNNKMSSGPSLLLNRSTTASPDRAASGRLGSPDTRTKDVWVWTRNRDVMSAAVESGWTTLIFTPDTTDLAYDWTSIARIKPFYLEGGQFLDVDRKQVAVLGQVATGEQLDYLPALMGQAEIVVMSTLDWQVIPAENLVAAFDDSKTSLYATANTASDAQVYLEALNKGTDGVVMNTDDPQQIYALRAYLNGRRETKMGVRLVEAKVTQVEPVGVGDRVCVDLCNLLNPGEGLLVGSFARALFLVHSECIENNSTASRPFRINAGPVHAYVGMADGSTAYLSELHTGSQVMVVDGQGRSRSVLVGRVKIETRPLLLVEVEAEGHRHSVLLQNVESVCFVTTTARNQAVPVTSLKVGDILLLNLQEETFQSGIQMQEFFVEK
ncbi:unnamed protein product [Sphagnum jensenii]|uniref:3-dehydroquinate synthase n=1 Tax=Sphagnum jensenii TaxID=128206 RepID=A0ABP0VMY3_9BRYO